MRSIFKNKIAGVAVFLPLGLITNWLLISDHYDSIYYTLGGIYRGLRCAKAGIQIAASYSNVRILYFSMESMRILTNMQPINYITVSKSIQAVI